jgi:transcriptional regulator with XRE-family HTH domain
MISDKIKALQKQNKVSQNDLANFIGITKNGLQIALKKNEFKVSTLKKIADVFKVSIGYFFEDETSSDVKIEEKEYRNFTAFSTLNEPNLPFSYKLVSLEEKNKMLVEMLKEKEKMIEEKERLIKILIERKP